MRILVGTLAAVTSLTACGAGDIPMSDTGFATGTDTGEEGTGTTEGTDTDGPECTPDAMVECGELDRCWATEPAWGAWLRWTDPADVQWAVNAGTFKPQPPIDGSDCYSFGDADDGETCVFMLDCESLLSIPEEKLGLVKSNCSTAIGPWDWIGAIEGDPFDDCWAVFGSLAVQMVEVASPPLSVGEEWDPCPNNEAGEPTICTGLDVVCVEADFGEANICLPLSGCPDDHPFGTLTEVGWGGACYPRCDVDNDCGTGMVCAAASQDGAPMCAWPR